MRTGPGRTLRRGVHRRLIRGGTSVIAGRLSGLPFLRVRRRSFAGLAAFLLCGGKKPIANVPIQIPCGPVGLQCPVGNGLSVLQHRPVALRSSDGARVGVAHRCGVVVARAVAVAPSRAGRAGRYPEAGRGGAVDRRAAQGLPDVRHVENLARGRFDHRDRRAAAGAGALGGTGRGPLHAAQTRGVVAGYGGCRGCGADGRNDDSRPFAIGRQRVDSVERLRDGLLHGDLPQVDRQIRRFINLANINTVIPAQKFQEHNIFKDVSPVCIPVAKEHIAKAQINNIVFA